MPAQTFIKPVEELLDETCIYEYYNQDEDNFSIGKKSRICHVKLKETGADNQNIVLMIFTIRNQNGKWKIHSEGAQRIDRGATVPLRNTAVNLARKNHWKYISIAIAGEETPLDDIISEYVISMESYTYGDNTVYDLTNELDMLQSKGKPKFYRTKVVINGQAYSFSFIRKDWFLNYLQIFDDRPYQNSEINDPINTETREEEERGINGGENLLFYGVPGAGKSYTVDKKINGAPHERVVFHPDYTYSDFVGQIMPKLKKDEQGNDKLSYEFVPGPFVKAMKAANERPQEMFYLVIEEINRGNAPAIFGDVFQLLDRKDDGSGKYSITNFDIAREVYGNEEEKVKLPNNLSILATMNTSDQNVFTLDTAFQRRWNMKYIHNDVEAADHANKNIEGSRITWGQFANVVNEEILEYNAELSSSEDKQLGAYFVNETELSPEKFPEKALKYLWDDAFKLEREKIFDETIRSIGDLVEKYRSSIANHRDPIKGVMRAEVYKRMMDMTTKNIEEAIDDSEIFEVERIDRER